MLLAESDDTLVGLLGLPDWTFWLERWLATSGLEILIWLLAGLIIIRLIRWTANRMNIRYETRFAVSDAIVQSEDAKHQRALVDVVAWTLIAIVIIVVFVHALLTFGVSVSSLIGPGAVIGAALGFGAQRVVQDVLAGFFVVAEKQYGYGDVVQLTTTGGAESDGTVEDVTLRVTKLRTSDGEVVTVPNGQVVRTINLSKDWARAVVDVPIPSEADLGLANEVLDRVGARFYADSHWHRLLLDPPAPLGATSMELDSVTVRMVARTLPGKQFEVSRALRVEIVQALAIRGITVGPARTGEPTASKGD